MEFGTFSSPESSSPKPSSESQKDDDSKSKEKKKKSTSAAALAEIATSDSVKREQAEQRKLRSSKKESYWQKIISAPENKSDSADIPLFGIPKPEDTASGLTSAGKEAAALSASDNAERSETTSAELSPADNRELKRAAHDFAEIQLHAADGELHDLPLDMSASPIAAETAADVALLRSMQERLADDNPQTAAQAIEQASQAAVERIENLSIEPAEIVDTDPQGAALPPNTDTLGGMGPQRSLAEALPPLPDRATEDRMVFAASAAAPPIPPLYGNSGPSSPDYSGGRPGSFSARNTELAANAVSLGEAAREARAAAGQGLLAGGLVGYFIGRRRGKKIGQATAERQSAPVKRGLERQLQNLQATIVHKESQIKALAREKVQAITGVPERQRFVKDLLQPVPKATGKNIVVPHAEQPTAEAAVFAGIGAGIAGELYARQPATAASAFKAELQSNQSPAEFARSENVGRLLVEVPLAAAAANIADKAERSPVVPFHKTAEEFSREELVGAAEKISVQGLSLKEMMQLGSLDERAVRRVVGEFLEGRDVSAAVSREIREKELKYERDPRMRQSTGGQAASLVAGGIMATSSDSINGHNDANDHRLATDDQSASSTYSGPRPQPDAATLKAIRDKQIATITVTVVLVSLTVAVLLGLTA
ncbi:MAG TPA: hypothetical protein VF575_02835 [Candidatus Saccharimonadales bacterium]|jgi:hypothetical protein